MTTASIPRSVKTGPAPTPAPPPPASNAWAIRSVQLSQRDFRVTVPRPMFGSHMDHARDSNRDGSRYRYVFVSAATCSRSPRIIR